MDIGSPTPISIVIDRGAQYTYDKNATVSVEATDLLERRAVGHAKQRQLGA